MEQAAKLKRTWNLAQVLRILQKVPENYCPCLLYLSDQVSNLISCGSKDIYSKMLFVSCTNTHHAVTDLVNHEMAKNTKTWISWEQNITFPQNLTFGLDHTSSEAIV